MQRGAATRKVRDDTEDMCWLETQGFAQTREITTMKQKRSCWCRNVTRDTSKLSSNTRVDENTNELTHTDL